MLAWLRLVHADCHDVSNRPKTLCHCDELLPAWRPTLKTACVEDGGI